MSHQFEMQHPTHTTIFRDSSCSAWAFWRLAAHPEARQQTDDAKVTTQMKDAGVKRYTLTGRVVSIDKPAQSISVDGDEIPGFMAAMTMPYQVKDAACLDKLSPGDQIKAEIVVGSEGAYLEKYLA